MRQVRKDATREVVPTVIAILAIIVVLVVQYRLGWMKTGEGWETIVLNISPTVGIFILYIAYHSIRAPYILDVARHKKIEAQSHEIATLREAIDKSKPNFECSRLEQLVIGAGHPPGGGIDTIITVRLTIGNDGAPSIAKAWRLTVKTLQSPSVEVGPAHMFGPVTLGREHGKQAVILQEEELIYNKVSTTPIPTGAEVSGHIFFVLQRTEPQTLSKGTQVTLFFRDIKDHEYSLSESLKREEPGVEPKYIPGTKISFGQPSQ